MADDKRDGDDLFEDLDKFFAPIKDVEWDEPAGEGARDLPSEEHVAVRPSEPSIGDRVETPPPSPGESLDDEGEETSWYDTSVIETLDGVDDPNGDPSDEVDVTHVDVVRVEEPSDARSDPFAGMDDDDPTDLDTDTADWSVVDEPHSESPVASFPAVDEADDLAAGPSADDLEAAAEHFSTSEERDRVLPSGGAYGLAEQTPETVEKDILADLREPDDRPRTVTVGTEGLGGPSWQEPASVEVGADAEARRGPNADERDVPAAFLTGIVLAGVALGALLLGKAAFAVVATAVVVLGQVELYGMMRSRRSEPATAVGLITGVLMMAGAYFRGEPALLAMFALGVMATFLWFTAVPAAHRKDTLANIGLTLLNVAWIPLLAGYLLIMLDQGDGTSLVITVIGLTFVYDTAAFLGGSVTGGQFFERPLAPSISPNKSIEGLIIATLVTAFVSVALVTSFVKPFEDMRIESLLLALVVAGAATFGDLAESLVKRDLGIKDMGSVLPGHGGVLDRIDSLLFVAPAVFLFLRVVFT